MKHLILVLFSISSFLVVFKANAQTKFLFDAKSAESAGNADWVIDADSYNLGWSTGPAVLGGGNEANAQKTPNPVQSGITASTSEGYWKGGISAWAVELVQLGYYVETLPYNGLITYGNSSNTQDLSNYDVFVVCEPNILFTSSEKTAIMQFVQNGGGLFMVSDHDNSDRNNDGYDSPYIWNDLINNNSVQTNPFGFVFDYADFSQTTTNIPNLPSDPLLHGTAGDVTQAQWSAGTSLTLSPTANSSVKGVIYKTGSSFGNTNVMVAYATFGSGKVVGFGDSSPCDDGTGDNNDVLYDGWLGDANGNHRKLILNASIWLATSSASTPTVSTLAATSVGATSATLNGTVNPNAASTTYWFEWGLTTAYGNSTTSTNAGNGSLQVIVSSNLAGLTAGNTYHYRLVASNNQGTTYGSYEWFAPGVPTLSTTAPSSITAFSASSGGNISFTGGLPILSRGVCYATTSNPTLLSSTVQSGSGSGVFVSNMVGLSANATYFVRAFATNSSGTYYGENQQFTTLATLPVISTVQPSSITNNSALSGGSIASTGGLTIIAKGVCWSLNANPSIVDNFTNEGSGSDLFTSTITGLLPSTSYHVRAYATNSLGTAYGSEFIFTTLANPYLTINPSVTTVPSFAGNAQLVVSSNIVWTAQSNSAWCSVIPSGTGTSTLSVSYELNDSEARDAIITFSGNNLPPVTTTIHQLKGEPSAFPTSFSAANIVLNWEEPIEGVLPTAYLVRMSTVGFDAIILPQDGVPIPDSEADKNIPYGTHNVVYKNINPATTYYFKLFAYRGDNNTIDYKLDGTIPQIRIVTNP